MKMEGGNCFTLADKELAFVQVCPHLSDVPALSAEFENDDPAVCFPAPFKGNNPVCPGRQRTIGHDADRFLRLPGRRFSCSLPQFHWLWAVPGAV